MKNYSWIDVLPVAATVADKGGTIVYMNEKAIDTFKDDGGKELIGKNLFECHQPESNKTIQKILDDRFHNIYTISKKGKKKLIYQVPWIENNEVKGIVELSLEIPSEMPHFDRD